MDLVDNVDKNNRQHMNKVNARPFQEGQNETHFGNKKVREN